MSSFNQWRLGRSIALAVVAGSLALAAPSQAQATVGLQPTSLKATNIEDWSTPWFFDNTDEAQLDYGGQKWGGKAVLNVPTYGPFPVARFTGSSMVVDLLEWDGGSVRHLTSGPVFAGTVGSGGTLFLSGTDFSYQLTYKIVAVSSQSPSLRVTVGCSATGDEQLECTAGASDGSAPYVFQWYVNGSHAGTGTRIEGYCGVDREQVAVTVHATDAIGRTGSATASLYCLSDAF